MRVAALALVVAACGSDGPAGELRYYRDVHRDPVLVFGADGRVRADKMTPGDTVVIDDAAGTFTLDSPSQPVHQVFAFDGDRAMSNAGEHTPLAVRDGDHYTWARGRAGFTIESDGRVVMDDGTEWGRVSGYGDTVGLHRRAFALLVIGPLPYIPTAGRRGSP